MTRLLAVLCLSLVGLYPAVLSCATARPAERSVSPEDPAASGLVVTLEIFVAYGEEDETLGFVPAGNEHEALGPNDFEVDDEGMILVRDPVRRRIFAVRPTGDDGGLLEPLGTLGPRPELPEPPAGLRAEKTSAETAELIIGEGESSRRVAIDARGPLASVRPVGVDGQGRAWALVERFRELGRLEVDREIVVVDREGTLVVRLEIVEAPVVMPLRELVLGPDGGLYHMVAGDEGVRFTRYEVRP